MEIRGKKILITGAASGIGRAMALRVARTGGRLFLTDINAADLGETASLARAQGGEVCPARAFDIADHEAMLRLAQEVHAGFGSIDILVSVAGVALFSQLEDMQHSAAAFVGAAAVRAP